MHTFCYQSNCSDGDLLLHFVAALGLQSVNLSTSGDEAIISCGSMRVGLDSSGGISTLRLGSRQFDVDWAPRDSPILSLKYITYNRKELWDTKINLTCTEPGCPNPIDAEWPTRLTGLWHNGTAAVSALPSGSCMVRATTDYIPKPHS